MIGAVVQLMMMVIMLMVTLVVWMIRLTVLLAMAVIGALSSNSRRR
jgi:hypothetical protein